MERSLLLTRLAAYAITVLAITMLIVYGVVHFGAVLLAAALGYGLRAEEDEDKLTKTLREIRRLRVEYDGSRRCGRG